MPVSKCAPLSRPKARRTLEEHIRQRKDVFRTFAQRRQGNGKHGNTIVQIFEKGTLATSFPIRRHEQMKRTSTPTGCPPHADHGLLLQDMQDLRLNGQGKLVDVLNEQRTAIGKLEQPFAGLNGTRERAFAVAEQFAFGLFLGQPVRTRRLERDA